MDTLLVSYKYYISLEKELGFKAAVIMMKRMKLNIKF